MNSRRVVQMIAFTLLCVGLLLLVSKRMRSDEKSWQDIVADVQKTTGVGLASLSKAFTEKRAGDKEMEGAELVISALDHYLQKANKEEITFKTSKDRDSTRAWYNYFVAKVSSEGSFVEMLKREFEENQQRLAAGDRLLALPAEFAGLPIFYLRTLKQPNGWMCAHFTLFHASIVSDLVQKKANLQPGSLDRVFEQSGMYDIDAFKEFYNGNAVGIYGNDQSAFETDPVTGLRSPSDNWLNETQIWDLARNIGIRSVYPVSYHVGRNDEFGVIFAQPLGEDEAPTEEAWSIGRTIEKRGGFRQYLRTLAQNKRAPWVMHFPAHVGNNHWILYSVVNMTGDLGGTIILMFDSIVGAVSENSHAAGFIRFLKNTYLEGASGGATSSSSSSVGASSRMDKGKVARSTEGWKTYRSRVHLMDKYQRYKRTVVDGSKALGAGDRSDLSALVSEISVLNAGYGDGSTDKIVSGKARDMLRIILDHSDELASK